MPLGSRLAAPFYHRRRVPASRTDRSGKPPSIMQVMEYEPLPATRSRTVPKAPPPRRSRRLLRWTWPVLAALLIGAITGVAVAAAIHVPKVDDLADYTP